MTNAERNVIKYLMHDGGCDYCQKCVYLNKPSCCAYVSPTNYDREADDDYCIDGMVKYFEEQSNKKL